MKTAYKVIGLDCTEEVALLKKALLPAAGIEKLEFNTLQAKMVVHYDPQQITSEQIQHHVSQVGLTAAIWGKQVESFWQKQGRLIFCIASFTALACALIFDQPLFYLASIFFGIWFVVPKALFALRRFVFDMNILMIVAIGGAIAINQWFEGASVAFLFSLALLLEQWSVKRAHTAIYSLMELSPKIANVIDRGEVPVEDVKVGEIILVKPGEKIPLDGVVTSGSSSVDQSTITGESIPVSKASGDQLYAGTLNQEGALELQVTKKQMRQP